MYYKRKKSFHMSSRKANRGGWENFCHKNFIFSEHQLINRQVSFKEVISQPSKECNNS